MWLNAEAAGITSMYSTFSSYFTTVGSSPEKKITPSKQHYVTVTATDGFEIEYCQQRDVTGRGLS